MYTGNMNIGGFACQWFVPGFGFGIAYTAAFVTELMDHHPGQRCYIQGSCLQYKFDLIDVHVTSDLVLEEMDINLEWHQVGLMSSIMFETYIHQSISTMVDTMQYEV